MQVALGQQLFLDAAFDAFAKQKAIGQHHGGAPAVLEQLHDQHHKQVGGFAGAECGGEVGFDAVFFHAAERWVSDDAVHSLAWTPAN
ncbi:hypothetical protein D3C80_1374120 [compost metagenome]